MSLTELNQKAFNQTLESLLPKETERFAVAVSGGADSLSLTLLAAEWAQKNKKTFWALTVEHGLRAESAEEAQKVHTFLSRRGIAHEILVWSGKKPQTGIEERAREARYNLLLKACRKKHIPVLLLGHHLDDQAETVLLRLSRGSGVDGLSAMAPVSEREGILLIRPLLEFSKEQIRSFLKKKQIDWIEDSSNQNTAYERVRWRQAKNDLEKMGLSAASLALSAKRLYRVRQALEMITNVFMSEHVKFSDLGYAKCPFEIFKSIPSEIAIRVLCRLMEIFSPHDLPVKLDAVERLYAGLPKAGTVSDCYIGVFRKMLYIMPERAKIPDMCKLSANSPFRWGALQIEVSRPVEVRPLDGAVKIKGMPAAVVAVFPSFWDGHQLLCIGTLDLRAKKADIVKKIHLRKRLCVKTLF